jgi:hypothetical protein
MFMLLVALTLAMYLELSRPFFGDIFGLFDGGGFCLNEGISFVIALLLFLGHCIFRLAQFVMLPVGAI